MKKKGLIIYIVISDCTVMGAWSNLKHLLEEINEYDIPLYYRINRKFKKFKNQLLENIDNERPLIIESPIYAFTNSEGKEYQIKAEVIK